MVKFARENTVLQINDDLSERNYDLDFARIYDYKNPTPILKNGPGKKAKESKSTKKYNAMKNDADKILK